MSTAGALRAHESKCQETQLAGNSKSTRIRDVFDNLVASFKDPSDNIFTTPEYPKMIPRSKEWAFAPLKPLESNTDCVEDFVTCHETHAYVKDVQISLDLFHEWRKWENGKQWKERAVKPGMKIYNHSLPNEAIDILKGETIADFSPPVIAGVLLNPKHRQYWDPKIDNVKVLEKLSMPCALIYLSVKTPVFVSDRDLVAIVYAYTFPDGQILIGTRSIDHPSVPNKKGYVRCWITNAVWHIRPHETDPNKSYCTYYVHMKLGGSLPEFLVNAVNVDAPTSVTKVLQYIKKAKKKLHKPGELWIDPMNLSMMGVDIPPYYKALAALELERLRIPVPQQLQEALDMIESKEREEEKAKQKKAFIPQSFMNDFGFTREN